MSNYIQLEDDEGFFYLLVESVIAVRDYKDIGNEEIKGSVRYSGGNTAHVKQSCSEIMARMDK